MFVVKNEGKTIAALVCAETDEEVWGHQPPDALYAHSMMVALSHRGQNIGSYLLRWCEEKAQAAGKHFLRLDCQSGNEKLVRYYQNLGFIAVGQKQYSAELGGGHVLLMQKTLT